MSRPASPDTDSRHDDNNKLISQLQYQSDFSTTNMEYSKTATAYGHGSASDPKGSMALACSQSASKVISLDPISADPRQQDIQGVHLQVPMPLLSNGLVTFAYRRALLNRIKEPKLYKGGRYDLCKYTPVFLHDTLMLPGSLANLIGKGSSLDVLKRMTPALLPGHHVHPESQSKEPCLVQSQNPNSYVQGMVFFGQGKIARDFIHKHYRPQAKRKKVQVEIDVMVLKPPQERQHEQDFWIPQRRTVWVNAWRWNAEIEGCQSGERTTHCADWTLEDYLAGILAAEFPMRIEASAKGDEEADGYLGRDILEYDIEVEKPEEREVIYGGPGRLDYERMKGNTWSGW